MNIILNPALLIIVICLLFYWYLKKTTQTPKLVRGDFIRDYEFPALLNQKLVETYPHLDEQQTVEIIRGLRSYFQICNLAQDNSHKVAMPSQAVDSAWHEFILHTKLYAEFCQQAFGQFLHHSPAEGMLTPTDAQQAIKATFKYACKLFNISRKAPAKMPHLFALDAQLNIPGGFIYSLNCLDNNAGHLCLSHIGELSH